MDDSTRFPDAFLWGAATSAYQIEGSPLADGAGSEHLAPLRAHPRADRRAARPATSPAITTAAARRRAAAWASSASNAYRFSIAWSRVLPAGRGAGESRRASPSTTGSSTRCSRTASSRWSPSTTGTCPPRSTIAAAGSTPTSPTGSPTTRAVMFRALGDRVPHVGDPERAVGRHRRRLSPRRARARTPQRCTRRRSPRTTCCARTARRSRPSGRSAGDEIGLVVNLEPKYPASDTPADLAATARADAYMNRQYLDPVFLGRYPEELPEIFGDAWPEHPDADIAAHPASRSTFSASTTTRASVSATTPRRSRSGAGGGAPGRSMPHRDRAGKCFPQGLTAVLLWVQAALRGAAPLRHRERRRLLRPTVGRPTAWIDDPLRVRVPARHISAARTTRSRRASTCAATSPGRCSTTSSGASGTRSGSGSCTWTTRRSNARRRRARGSTPRSSAANGEVLSSRARDDGSVRKDCDGLPPPVTIAAASERRPRQPASRMRTPPTDRRFRSSRIVIAEPAECVESPRRDARRSSTQASGHARADHESGRPRARRRRSRASTA